MKKVVLSVLLMMFILTGCGKKMETVNCKINKETTGVTINGDLIVKIDGNKFDSIKLVMDAVIGDDYLSFKEQFIDAFEAQFKDFDKNYGVKPVIKETSKGAQITISMTSSQAKEFYGSENNKEVTKEEVINTFTKQGYTCE